MDFDSFPFDIDDPVFVYAMTGVQRPLLYSAQSSAIPHQQSGLHYFAIPWAFAARAIPPRPA